MPDIIRDGTGKGYLAAVNKDNQLVTRAIAVPQHTKSTVDGSYFEATTGLITLTDVLEKGIIYLKNNESSTIIIDKLFLDIWESTGGSTTNGGIMKYYKNPTVTGGTSISPVNTNFSEPDVAGLDLKSLTTITEGTNWWIGYFTPGVSLVIEEEKIAVPPGYSFGVSLQAPTGNTSMNISCNVAFYRLDEELL